MVSVTKGFNIIQYYIRLKWSKFRNQLWDGKKIEDRNFKWVHYRYKYVLYHLNFNFSFCLQIESIMEITSATRNQWKSSCTNSNKLRLS